MIGKWILKLFGWKIDPNLPDLGKQSVMIAAPHTSNWDALFALATFRALNIPVRFTIKKEWMRFPFNILFKPLGAIPIDRTPKQPGEKRKSLVDAMADLFATHPNLVILITPEGSRSLRTEWKTGFYFVAKKANVPISLGYLDYKSKMAGVGKVIHTSDNQENDFREIMAFYTSKHPKYPEKFSTDVRYR